MPYLADQQGNRPTTERKSSYRPEIDGLRALAVVAVIANHVNKDWLPSGFLGVDVFFVISGYVITASLSRQSQATFPDFLLSFYVRRLRRLIPALVAFSVITGLLITLVNPGPGDSLRTGIASLFGLSNLYLLHQSTNYFGVSAEVNSFTHTWSLGVEEQFYLIFPGLVWFTGFGRLPGTGNRNLMVVLLLLCLPSFLLFCFLYVHNQSTAFFLMPTRFWELSSGALLYIGLQVNPPRKRIAQVMAPITLLGLIATFFISNSQALVATVVCVLLTALSIYTIAPMDVAYKFLTRPYVLYLGLISYSLYLWHWGVLSISRWTVGIHPWTVPFQLLLMLLLASLSYKYIETPFRNKAWPGGTKGTLFIGISASLIASITLLCFGLKKDTLYAGQRYLGLSSYPDNIIAGSEIKHSNCMLSGVIIFNASKFVQCSLPGKPGFPKVFFIGSSHAMHLAGLGESLNKRGYGVAFLAAQGTNFRPMLDNESIKFKFSTTKESTIATTVLSKSTPGDIIVVANRYPQDHFQSDDSFVTMSHATGLNHALLAWAKEQQKRGVKVIHMLPLHEYPFFDINQCSPQWFNAGMRETNICNPKNPDQRTNEIRQIKTLLPEGENLFHFDQRQVLCKDSLVNCQPFDKAALKPIFSNPDHLADHGASLLADRFEQFLRKLRAE